MNCYFTLEETPSAQVPKAPETFNNILKDFDNIVEIGTCRGIFSIWLYNNKKPDAKFTTYEIDPNWIQIPEKYKSLIDIKIMDCFSPECTEDIKSKIQAKGRSLLLCDGGHKNQEFNLYAQYLKPQDVIMLHDYTHNEQDHTEFNTIKSQYNWPHVPESSYDQIANTVKEENLEPYMYEEFKNVLWGSFIKK